MLTLETADLKATGEPHAYVRDGRPEGSPAFPYRAVQRQNRDREVRRIAGHRPRPIGAGKWREHSAALDHHHRAEPAQGSGRALARRAALSKFCGRFLLSRHGRLAAEVAAIDQRFRTLLNAFSIVITRFKRAVQYAAASRSSLAFRNTGSPGHRRGEATPSFGRLCRAMTVVSEVEIRAASLTGLGRVSNADLRPGTVASPS